MEEGGLIYCVEGVHDWGDAPFEPTVEPMLELLQRTGYWSYVHRTCATMQELEYRLKTEWQACPKGSILYFNTHGASDQVWLQRDDQPVGLGTLKEWVFDARGCHVHFGGCNTFGGGEEHLRDLMQHTWATSVSGYATDDVDWLAPIKPALALELLFFALLTDVNITRRTRPCSEKLESIKEGITQRFPDCEFRVLVHRHEDP